MRNRLTISFFKTATGGRGAGSDGCREAQGQSRQRAYGQVCESLRLQRIAIPSGFLHLLHRGDQGP